jgi:hypothetical protein
MKRRVEVNKKYLYIFLPLLPLMNEQIVSLSRSSRPVSVYFALDGQRNVFFATYISTTLAYSRGGESSETVDELMMNEKAIKSV